MKPACNLSNDELIVALANIDAEVLDLLFEAVGRFEARHLAGLLRGIGTVKLKESQ